MSPFIRDFCAFHFSHMTYAGFLSAGADFRLLCESRDQVLTTRIDCVTLQVLALLCRCYGQMQTTRTDCVPASDSDSSLPC